MIELRESRWVAPSGCDVIREWHGGCCRSCVTNRSGRPVRVDEVVLFDVPHGLPADTPVYGESFQMLAQTLGTVGAPADLGSYPDRLHYRIAEPAGFRGMCGVVILAPPGRDAVLVGFSSCRRFNGRFYLNAERLKVVMDTEGLELAAGETWELEEVFLASGSGREVLLDRLADAIARHHPRLPYAEPPTGWCSWYCFGPDITEQRIGENLEAMARGLPGLRHVQVDDGYQPFMGDWLETGPAFGGGIQRVLGEVRARGFEPALWVAPFIAEARSRIFREHPDWFVQAPQGGPLDSSRVGFGGWRRGPWYCLDGTHPEAQGYLEGLFRTLRREWGCTYFKLDANYWGAIHGGRHHDPQATRIEAYRRGMAAILRGAEGGYVLGCNAPRWASLGLVHGQRTSGDIERTWASIKATGRENLQRAWQNGRLWWNDPDCVLLSGTLPENEVQFHATVVAATGGMVFSGDDLTRLPPERLALLRRMLPPGGRRMRFGDDTFRVGTDGRRIAVLNWDDGPADFTVPLPGRVRLTDVWTGVDMGEFETVLRIAGLPGRSARWLEIQCL